MDLGSWWGLVWIGFDSLGLQLHLPLCNVNYRCYSYCCCRSVENSVYTSRLVFLGPKFSFFSACTNIQCELSTSVD